MIEIDGRPGAEERPATRAGWPLAVWRGFRNRCPHCGEGRVFGRFLKVRHACEACGTELHHHRADDLPPYLVIFIVGHLVGLAILEIEMRVDDVPLWLQMAVWPLVALVLSLALLQPVKGAVVGLQYGLGMHGFAGIRGVGAVTASNREASDEQSSGPDGAADRAGGLRRA